MVTLQTADNALKEVYLGVVSEQLNTSINPLLARINQTTSDVWGKEIRKLAPYGINGGIGAGDEDGNLPSAAGNNYAQFVLELKNLYGKIEISDKAIRASQHSAGSFVNLLNAEMEGLIKASSFNFGRMLYGDGTGTLGKITANTNNSITLDTISNIVEGMVVDIVKKSTGEVVSGARRITAIDRSSKVAYLTGTDMASNAFQTSDSETFVACVQGSYGKEITGLGAIFKKDGSLYGLTRSSYSWMTPYIEDLATGSATQDITDITIQKAIDNLEETAGSTVDFIVCSAGVKRNYQEYFNTYRRNIDVMELNGGYKAMSYNGIPLVSDKFAKPNTMYLLNTKEFNLHQLCDWQWLEGEDGKVIKQTQNKPTYTATLVKYADIICNLPSGQAMITGITEA